jgi:hypothetical protein
MKQDELEEPTRDHHLAENLLGDWRAAERDTIAAREAARVASLALDSAKAAEEAAVETEGRQKPPQSRSSGRCGLPRAPGRRPPWRQKPPRS